MYNLISTSESTIILQNMVLAFGQSTRNVAFNWMLSFATELHMDDIAYIQYIFNP